MTCIDTKMQNTMSGCKTVLQIHIKNSFLTWNMVGGVFNTWIVNKNLKLEAQRQRRHLLSSNTCRQWPRRGKWLVVTCVILLFFWASLMFLITGVFFLFVCDVCVQSGTLLLYLKVHGVIKICSGEIVQHIMVYIFISILLKGSVTDFLVLETKSEMSTHLTSWTT